MICRPPIKHAHRRQIPLISEAGGSAPQVTTGMNQVLPASRPGGSGRVHSSTISVATCAEESGNGGVGIAGETAQQAAAVHCSCKQQLGSKPACSSHSHPRPPRDDSSRTFASNEHRFTISLSATGSRNAPNALVTFCSRGWQTTQEAFRKTVSTRACNCCWAAEEHANRSSTWLGSSRCRVQ